MITNEKKKRIDSLTTEEMLYEINLGHRSRFQRESFAYLQARYQNRIAESSLSQHPTPQPLSFNLKKTDEWHNKAIGKIGIGIIVIILGTIAVWALNHYLDLGL